MHRSGRCDVGRLSNARSTNLELRRCDGQGWRAIFFQSGFEHSLTSHAGAAWGAQPVGGGEASSGMHYAGSKARTLTARLDYDGRIATIIRERMVKRARH